MTLETIDGDAGSNVTAGTKVLTTIYSCNPAILAWRGVAIDAPGKTGLFRTNTLVHGLIALV
jgi:hypothetical protein